MHVVVVPAFNELTVGDTVYPDSRPGDLFAGGLDSLKLALVGPTKGQAGDDFVSRLDDVLNSNVDVGERYLAGQDAAFNRLRTNLVAIRPDANVVQSAYLINDFQPPPFQASSYIRRTRLALSSVKVSSLDCPGYRRLSSWAAWREMRLSWSEAKRFIPWKMDSGSR